MPIELFNYLSLFSFGFLKANLVILSLLQESV